MAGILGKKLGQTQMFTRDGRALHVTVVQAGPCVVVQKKILSKEGYNAIQLGFEEKDFRSLTHAMRGHFQKNNLKAYRWLREFRVNKIDAYQVGDLLSAKLFKVGDRLEITGVSKGKGFQGVIKRHHKKGGPRSHGSCLHRSTGSIGQRTYPGKVFKNMKLPGHMGSEQVTVQNLEVVEVRPEENLIFIKGAIPGANQSLVILKNAAQDFESRQGQVPPAPEQAA